MLACLGLHGFILVVLVCLYVTWSDVEVAADLCLLGLLFELVGSVVLARYVLVTDGVFFLHVGTVFAHPVAPQLCLSFCFDEVSGVFIGILTFALLICFFFLTEYFEYDSRAGGILLLSALFSQAATLYFCAFDLVTLVFFWELLGLISFLLVQHWAFRLTTYKAGLKVLLFSLIGDLFLFFFLFWVLDHFGTTDMAELLALLHVSRFDFVSVGALLFRVQSLLAFCLYAAFSLKAAQWFFYPWLLDAMEAPVPISAQLHSSTLVVVGFYLLFRFELLFLFSPAVMQLLTLTGVVTSVGAAFLGFYQTDGKRLLAASTASQLGYVSVAFSSGLFLESVLLLGFCCCGKALVFVWFGVFMRRVRGLSDLRLVGGSACYTWVERAGLFVSVAGFTVFPGIFGWHLKSLLTQGEVWTTSYFALRIGLELLEASWFYSSLYLWGLFMLLFFSPSSSRDSSYSFHPWARRGWAATLQNLRGAVSQCAAHFIARDLVPQAGESGLLLGLLWGFGASFCSYWGLLLLLQVESAWGGLTLGSLLSYY